MALHDFIQHVGAKVAEHHEVLKPAAYTSFSVSGITGPLSFLNDNAGVFGLGVSFLSLLCGVGFARANYQINKRRLQVQLEQRAKSDE